MVTLLLVLACSSGADAPDDGVGLKDSAGADSAGDDSAGDDSGGGDSAPPDTGETADPPMDVDRDGYLDDADCDDLDARVHPGAVDACDGVDADCDGHVVDEGGCGERTEVTATLADAWSRGGDEAYAHVDCVWGPTGGDVLVDRTYVEDWSRSGWAAYGARDGGLSEVLTLTKSGGEAYTHCTPVGDLDGDGTADVAIHGGSLEPEPIAAVAILSGDESRWPAGTSPIASAAFARWEGVAAADGFSEQLDAGDIDGDGLPDIVTHAPLDRGDEFGGKSGWLFVLRGRLDGFPMGGDVGEMAGEWSYPHLRDDVEATPIDESFSIQAVHPDLDGDGRADVLGVGPYGAYVVLPGAALVDGVDAPIEDLVDVRSEEAGTVLRVSAGGCAADYDGDGIADCLGKQTGSDARDDGTSIIVSGAGLAAGADALDASITLLPRIEGIAAVLLADFDTDGLPDVGIADADEDGVLCVVASGRLPLGGTLDIADVAPCWRHADGVGTLDAIAAADVDASGFPDLALAQHPDALGDTVPLYLLRDLALPWDDATRW